MRHRNLQSRITSKGMQLWHLVMSSLTPEIDSPLSRATSADEANAGPALKSGPVAAFAATCACKVRNAWWPRFSRRQDIKRQQQGMAAVDPSTRCFRSLPWVVLWTRRTNYWPRQSMRLSLVQRHSLKKFKSACCHMLSALPYPKGNAWRKQAFHWPAMFWHRRLPQRLKLLINIPTYEALAPQRKLPSWGPATCL